MSIAKIGAPTTGTSFPSSHAGIARTTVRKNAERPCGFSVHG
jgi:hypothetical protein